VDDAGRLRSERAGGRDVNASNVPCPARPLLEPGQVVPGLLPRQIDGELSTEQNLHAVPPIVEHVFKGPAFGGTLKTCPTENGFSRFQRPFGLWSHPVASQIVTSPLLRDPPDVARRLPLGLNATPMTAPVRSRRVSISLPLAASQTLIVPPQLVVARRLPSGL